MSWCKKLLKSRGKSDGFWSFCVLAAGFMSTAISNGCLYSFGVILPQLMDYFGETRAKTAAVGSMGQGVGYLFSPIASYLFERFGFRRVVLFSALIAVVGLTGSAAAPVLPLLYLTYGCLTSIGLSFIHNASVVVVMKHFVKWRSISSGVVQSAFGIGMLIITLLARKVIDVSGWRWTFGSWAAIVATVFLWAMLFDGRETHRTTDIQRETAPNTNRRSKLLLTLKNRLLVLYSCSFALSYMAYYVPHVFLIKYAEQRLGIPRDQSTILYAYFAVVLIASRIMYCKVSTYRYFNRFVMYQVSMALSGVVHLCLPFCKSYTHLAIVMVCLGFLDGGFWGLAALLVTDCAGIHNLNYSWGVFNFITSIAGICGSPLAGLVADLSNSYIPAFYASGITLILASSLMFLRRWTKSQNYCDERLEIQHLVTNCKDEFLVVVERETVL